MRTWQGGVTLAALWLTGCAWGPGPGGAASLAAAIGLLWLAACTTVTPTEEDGGTRDGGTYDPCCVEGRLTTCYCPPNAACNYGQGLIVCDDGSCSTAPHAQCAPDGGVIDAGTWEPCCSNGVLTSCYCPPNTACNYGLGWVSCGEGTCAYVNYGQPDAGDPCQQQP
ncbi:hypothetical protein [Archangium sp. Cb G35]|uniref:hypothetical protein n=1 Tax=Archangium sp. Cb G35 TaxID=1920190 RepID=UPI0011613078|nr:hypothetical protein [Archangium sp. Cb G35]